MTQSSRAHKELWGAEKQPHGAQTQAGQAGRHARGSLPQYVLNRTLVALGVHCVCFPPLPHAGAHNNKQSDEPDYDGCTNATEQHCMTVQQPGQ